MGKLNICFGKLIVDNDFIATGFKENVINQLHRFVYQKSSPNKATSVNNI